MRYTLIPALAAGLFATAVVADEPVLLSNTQLDSVNAGATALADGAAIAIADLLAETVSVSDVLAVKGSFATATNASEALATSTFFDAQASAASISAASLP